MPPGENEFTSLGASLVGEDLTGALQLRAFPDAGSACKPGITSSQPHGAFCRTLTYTLNPHTLSDLTQRGRQTEGPTEVSNIGSLSKDKD